MTSELEAARAELKRLATKRDELEVALAARTHEAETIEARANTAIRSLEDQLRARLEAAMGDTDDHAAVPRPTTATC